jgi:hypothetical protein
MSIFHYHDPFPSASRAKLDIAYAVAHHAESSDRTAARTHSWGRSDGGGRKGEARCISIGIAKGRPVEQRVGEGRVPAARAGIREKQRDLLRDEASAVRGELGQRYDASTTRAGPAQGRMVATIQAPRHPAL